MPHANRLSRIPSLGRISGVCAGTAHYLGFSPFWTRIVFIVLLLCFPVPMILGYVAAACLLPVDHVRLGRYR